MTKQTISPLITILGPTASGKTKLAVRLAKKFNGEIISADSRQVYRHMDIGTGKDLQEYGDVPYHLIDIIEPSDEYNLFNFTNDFINAFKKITLRGSVPFLVGGTGMYLDAVLSRYSLTIANIDKKTRAELEKKTVYELIHTLKALNDNLHNSTDLRDKERIIRAIEICLADQRSTEVIDWPSFRSLNIGIKISKEELQRKVKDRLKARLNEGLIEEVASLRLKGISDERLDSFGLEYRHVLAHLRGEYNFNDMFQKLNAAIIHFTKQQHKWFRNMEKKGIDIHWVNSNIESSSELDKLIEEFNKPH